MLILSIDQSTETGSAVILDDRRLVTSRQWAETRNNRQQLFPNLRAMLHDAGVEPGAIQLYVVGVGPGSYSGLRVALAAAMAMAIPGRTPVYGITSAEGLAWQAAEAEQAMRVRIVGDARRDQWWTRCFERMGSWMSPVDGWELAHPREFRTGTAEAVATSDWERIGALLKAAVPPGVKLIPRQLIPGAETLACLAAARLEQGIASEPLAPIYMHPAVQTKTEGCQIAGHSV